ncbi:MAG: leucine--tRNA ligase [Bacteroidetes bacterium HGW-Bacteroidetes-2]|nr:MAG: leucine--tRNA ligase [Bacteroidetes bacterium HGW-Bacteroidetes-2]
MKYHFNDIEAKWQKFWKENQTFKAENQSDKEKYYVLDMFPYPSGAGLHVGHPLGYIASDIYARYKRHKGFNVLHPMGYDSFGLPAEQYAIQTGQHPAITTETNINRYREQLGRIGFSFDWSREVRTSNPDYYKWTQWIFIELFHSWYNKNTDKAESIDTLISIFTREGNELVNAVCDENVMLFTSEMWNSFDEEQQQKILLQYRLTYLAETEVNWCPALGTVLANDEIVNGVSERGGHPVIRKKMTQWSMRITAYAQRLLDGLQKIDWPQPLKDSQTNWIGKSVGAEVKFQIPNSKFQIPVFTTRPDTIFGVSFMTLAPEHDLVKKITTPEQKEAVEAYVEQTAKRSERERMADVKTISGVFTGAYAEHPFSKEPIPIWIGDYVLASYGTGAVMAVPCGDERDYAFAKHFNIPIPNIFDQDISENAFSEKEGFKIVNSDFLNGLSYKEATTKAIEALENIGQGTGKTNYRLRDAVFSRQRYWGEPFPVYYVNGLPKTIDPEHLPIRLPEVEKYLPTEDGQPPLGRAKKWHWDATNNEVVEVKEGEKPPSGVWGLELNTMPGWAGSSWYLFRYMDAQNENEFASKEALEYWQNVDLYIGGSEHATGHLLYSRFWTKFLHDRGFLHVDEPFKKLINQGMILGESAIINVIILKTLGRNSFGDEERVSPNTILINNELIKDLPTNGSINLLPEKLKHPIKAMLKNEEHTLKFIEITSFEYSIVPQRIDVSLVDLHNLVNLKEIHNRRMYTEIAKSSYYDGENLWIKGDFDVFKVSREVEKMSKSKYNVVSPDAICEQYGADTLRMYEMFLGPLEQAKPWNMAGITGVHSFLKKFWKLYHTSPSLLERGSGGEEFYVSNSPASIKSLKTLHKTIKKVEEDMGNFSFNTSVSTFMIAVNELTADQCTSREVLDPLLILISPYAPHIAEELWSKLGHTTSIATAPFPQFEEKYLVESTKAYPISFNGKMRFTLELPMDLSKQAIEREVMANEKTMHYLEGRIPKKVIVVPGKIVNIVG